MITDMVVMCVTNMFYVASTNYLYLLIFYDLYQLPTIEWQRIMYPLMPVLLSVCLSVYSQLL